MDAGDAINYGCPGGIGAACACTGECRIPPDKRAEWRKSIVPSIPLRKPLEDNDGAVMYTIHYRGFHVLLSEALTPEEEVVLKKMLDHMRENIGNTMTDITRDIEDAASAIRGRVELTYKDIMEDPGFCVLDAEAWFEQDFPTVFAQAALTAIDYAGKLSRIAELEAEVERLRQGVLLAARWFEIQAKYNDAQYPPSVLDMTTMCNAMKSAYFNGTPPADQEKKDD